MHASADKTIELLGTTGCHLCEEAFFVVLPLLQHADIALRQLDIADAADSETLIQRYGLRIPVLRCAGRELDWPFNEADVRRWLNCAV